MSTGHVVIGVFMLLVGLGMTIGGFYLQATKGTGRGGNQSIWPYILLWLPGLVLIVGGAVEIYNGTK